MPAVVEQGIRHSEGRINMNLFPALSKLEDRDDLHLGRLLVLLNAFAKRDGSGTVNGLTKLAKLDFLLRYPVYLQRALEARHSQKSAKVTDHEQKSVESKMVRFRYGPWDFRYRRFLNLLVGMGLANVSVDGRTVKIGLTQAGQDAATALGQTEAYQDIKERAKLLKGNLDLTATNLMKFVYETFPEIADLRLGEQISHEH
jgi:hypothetical protein